MSNHAQPESLLGSPQPFHAAGGTLLPVGLATEAAAGSAIPDSRARNSIRHRGWLRHRSGDGTLDAFLCWLCEWRTLAEGIGLERGHCYAPILYCFGRDLGFKIGRSPHIQCVSNNRLCALWTDRTMCFVKENIFAMHSCRNDTMVIQYPTQDVFMCVATHMQQCMVCTCTITSYLYVFKSLHAYYSCT